MSKKLKYSDIKKYVITDDVEKSNIHFRYCEKLQIPFITIRRKTKYSRVEIDMIAIDFKIMESVAKELSDNGFIIFFLESMGLAKNIGWVPYFGSTYWYIDILKEYDEVLAKTVFDYYYYALKRAYKQSCNIEIS
jgi:hypothetical protein